MSNNSYPMWLVPILIGSLVVLALASVLSANSNKPDTKISAIGDYSTFLEPDEASLYIRIDTTALNSSEASSKNAQISKNVIAALKSKGLTDKEIDTSSYNVYEKQDYYPLTEKPENDTKEYIASHSIRVKTNNVNKTGEYIDAALQNGGTSVDSVSFDLSDERKADIHDEAFRIASERAKESAKNKADVLDVNLGRLVDVSESTGGNYPWVGMTESVAKDSDDRTEINPQQQEYRISVTLTYEID